MLLTSFGWTWEWPHQRTQKVCLVSWELQEELEMAFRLGYVTSTGVRIFMETPTKKNFILAADSLSTQLYRYVCDAHGWNTVYVDMKADHEDVELML